MSEPKSVGEVLKLVDLPSPSDEYDERWRQIREAEEAQRRRAQLRFLDDMPITESDRVMLRSGTLDSTRCLQVVRTWLDTDRPWLVLSGAVGRGKTLAAVWALTVRSGRYIGAREAERVFVARYGDEIDEQRDLLKTKLLVLDDVGRERSAAGMEATLLDLVDARRGREKSILIANQSRDVFRKRYSDPRLLSRLDECAQWLSEGGPDLRRRG